VLLAALPALLAWLRVTAREPLPNPDGMQAPGPGAAPDADDDGPWRQTMEYAGATHYRGHEVRATTRGRPDADDAAAWTDADWIRHDVVAGRGRAWAVGCGVHRHEWPERAWHS
jgi:hypothetical protein